MHHILTTLATGFRRMRQTTSTDIRTAATVAPTTTAPERSGAGVEAHRIDDPHGSNTIVTLAGTVSTAALVQLTIVVNDVPSWWKIFLDLTDTEIPDTDSMDRLGAWLDVLEFRGYDLNLVGISPEHPALQP